MFRNKEHEVSREANIRRQQADTEELTPRETELFPWRGTRKSYPRDKLGELVRAVCSLTGKGLGGRHFCAHNKKNAEELRTDDTSWVRQ